MFSLKFKTLSNHVIPKKSLLNWKKLRAMDALMEVDDYDLSYAPQFIQISAECKDNSFLRRADKLLAEREPGPNASNVSHCIEIVTEQRDVVGEAAMEKKCAEYTNILKESNLILTHKDWTTKDLKRVAKIGRALGKTWSTWFLNSLPLNALTTANIITFLEEAEAKSWWTRPSLLEIFRAKFLSPVFETAKHLKEESVWKHELENSAQLTQLLNALRTLELEQDAENLAGSMSCW